MKDKSGRGSESGATPYDFGGPWKPSDLELLRRAARKEKNKRNALIAALSSFLVLGSLVLLIVTSPGWESLRDTFFKWAYGVEVLPKIIMGFGTNAMLEHLLH
jgi:polar amino acid transport system permease protein